MFKHKYLTQPALTPNDALIRAMDDLCKILKNNPPMKGETRTTINMLIDIFKGYEGKPTKKMNIELKCKKASKAKEESNIKEAQANAKELKK